MQAFQRRINGLQSLPVQVGVNVHYTRNYRVAPEVQGLSARAGERQNIGVRPYRLDSVAADGNGLPN